MAVNDLALTRTFNIETQQIGYTVLCMISITISLAWPCKNQNSNTNIMSGGLAISSTESGLEKDLVHELAE